MRQFGVCHEMIMFCREMESAPRAKYLSVESDPPASLLPQSSAAGSPAGHGEQAPPRWPLAGLLRTTIDDADCGLFEAVS
jgi:hypothetical protein